VKARLIINEISKGGSGFGPVGVGNVAMPEIFIRDLFNEIKNTDARLEVYEEPNSNIIQLSVNKQNPNARFIQYFVYVKSTKQIILYEEMETGYENQIWNVAVNSFDKIRSVVESYAKLMIKRIDDYDDKYNETKL
jgi:fructose 1,6-bisphosphatase